MNVLPKSSRRAAILALAAAVALVVARRLRPRLPLARFVVDGASMEPALRAGDRLLTWRGLTGSPRPRRGQIVVLRDPHAPGRELVKRVRAQPGESVPLALGRATVGDPHAAHHLAADEYFVAGDNGDASRDSRHFGPVRREQLVGRVVYRYWPPERAGRV